MKNKTDLIRVSNSPAPDIYWQTNKWGNEIRMKGLPSYGYLDRDLFDRIMAYQAPFAAALTEHVSRKEFSDVLIGIIRKAYPANHFADQPRLKRLADQIEERMKLMGGKPSSVWEFNAINGSTQSGFVRFVALLPYPDQSQQQICRWGWFETHIVYRLKRLYVGLWNRMFGSRDPYRSKITVDSGRDP